MPEMDGYTATRVLRADLRFADLPIIAMTAHALVEERQRCLEAGMNDHVTKPIEPDALFAALKRWVKPRQAPAGQAPPPAAPPPAKPAATAGEVPLPEVEGVDFGGGLKRVAGNRRLYRSLLEQFVAKQSDAGAQVAAALRSGDQTLAGRIAHTVKGVAGNLGIGAVQKAAEGLERAIRDDAATVSSALETFESVLGPMVQAIGRGLAATAPEPPAEVSRGPFDRQAATGAIARLRQLIEANDGEAADAFTAVENAVGGTVDKARVDALRDRIGDFDFDGALAKLEEIAGLCGVT